MRIKLSILILITLDRSFQMESIILRRFERREKSKLTLYALAISKKASGSIFPRITSFGMRRSGIEPMTFRSRSERSTTICHRCGIKLLIQKRFFSIVYSKHIFFEHKSKDKILFKATDLMFWINVIKPLPQIMCLTLNTTFTTVKEMISNI